MLQVIKNLLIKTPLYWPLKKLVSKLDPVRRTAWMAFKKPLVRLPLYFKFRKWNQTRTEAKDLLAWEKAGKPAPPPRVVKERVIRQYASRFSIKTLVETGTCYGDMVEAMRPDFNRLYSIELSERLHEIAKRRFAGVASVSLIHGDSGVELGALVKKIAEPVLFWLDGHYSEGETARGAKDTPIYEELEHIFNAQRNGDVILIDDARCFGTYPAYPSLEMLREFILSKRPDATFDVQDDIISIIQTA